MLQPLDSDTCWFLASQYAQDTVKAGLPSKALTGTLDIGIKGEEQAVVGELTIWGDDSGTTAKLSLQVRVPVTVTGPGKNDFVFKDECQISPIFKRQHEISRAAVTYFSTHELPDKLEGKTGLKCKNAKAPRIEDLMLTDKDADKPRVMPTEWKVTFPGDVIPTPELPIDGFYVLKFPLDLEPKGKSLKSTDNFDPALLPPCGARDYLLGKGLPARDYRCMIADHPVSVATMLTELQVKPDLWAGFAKVRASNWYYYSDKYNRITHGPWIEKISVFAVMERTGSARAAPDIDMGSKMHIYTAAGSKRRRSSPAPEDAPPAKKPTK